MIGKFMLLASSAILFSTGAIAQVTSTSNLIMSDGQITNCCTSYQDATVLYGITVCDSNDKTPNEVVECKLRYWRNEVERLEKKRADLDRKLTKARERVDAFKDAQKR